MVLSWIVVVVLVTIGIFAIKMNHLRHKFFIVMLILLALFLYSSMALVTTKNDLKFDNTENFFEAFKIYSGWLANGLENIKVISGNVLKMDWSSTNATFFDEEKKKE